MPHSRAEEDPPRRDTSNTIPPESAGEQDQDIARGQDGRIFLEHLEDAMNEHAELGRLLAH